MRPRVERWDFHPAFERQFLFRKQLRMSSRKTMTKVFSGSLLKETALHSLLSIVLIIIILNFEI